MTNLEVVGEVSDARFVENGRERIRDRLSWVQLGYI